MSSEASSKLIFMQAYRGGDIDTVKAIGCNLGLWISLIWSDD